MSLNHDAHAPRIGSSIRVRRRIFLRIFLRLAPLSKVGRDGMISRAIAQPFRGLTFSGLIGGYDKPAFRFGPALANKNDMSWPLPGWRLLVTLRLLPSHLNGINRFS
jgi:hypothetical protein